MYSFTNFFNSNKHMESNSNSNSKSNPSTPTQPKPKPKLERRNANKNINYTPSQAPSHVFHAPPHALHEPHVPSHDHHAPHVPCYGCDESFAIRTTRSIDVYPWGDRTSFRINGKEGELEFVWRSLGLNGPDDLAISEDDYEAMKVRSLSGDLIGLGDVDKSRGSNVSSRVELSRVDGVGVELCDGVVKEGVVSDNYTGSNVISRRSRRDGVRLCDGVAKDVGVSSSSRCSNVVSRVGRSRVDGGYVNGNGSDRVDAKLRGVVKDAVFWDNYRGSNEILGVDRSRGDDVDVKLCGRVVEDSVLSGGVVEDGVVSSNHRGSNVDIDQSTDADFDDNVDVKLCGKVVEDGVLSSGLVKDVISDWGEKEGVKVVVGGGRRGVRIRGERPPAVLLSPPPRMVLPVIDDACSSWDILRSFGPEGNISRMEDEQEESSSEDEGHHSARGDAVEGGDDNGTRRGRPVGLGSGVLSDSCSFTTNSKTNSNDDDSSSTTTDPMSISPKGRIKRQITTWLKGKHLGSGSYGSVYEGIDEGGSFFAVKEVSLLDQSEKGREIILQLEQEMAFLSQFEHENIVSYYGTDKDDSHLYIFLEYLSQGSLLSLYQQYRLLDSHVSGYTRQILKGLKYLHEHNVVHRDIKCANILLDVGGIVKLADFGLAKVAKMNDAKSCKGTSFWMAPEVVKPDQSYGRSADIWSLGCTVLEMLTRKFPYHPLDRIPAMYKIGRGEPPTVPESLSRDARDFILQCLQVDPDNRPSATELLEHSFVRRPLASTSPPHRDMRA